MRVTTVLVTRVALCAVAMAATLLVGCATSTSASNPNSSPDNAPSTVQLTSDFSRSKLIAADFVATMAQLPESKPSAIVLHTNKPSSRFGELLLSALQAAGYDLRVGDTQSENWLGYNANRDDTLSDTGNPIYTFIVSAGDVKLKRSYEVDKFGVKPAGSMFVRGATTDDIVLDNAIFSVRSSGAVAQENYQQEPVAQLVSHKESDVGLKAVPLPDPIVDNSKSPFSEFSNMYETGDSRYKSLFELYEVVDKEIYVFANDTLILGKQNKIQLHQLVQNFNRETDVMSVIGCSHGPTNIVNGNAYLANNRAFRVKEEFVLAGLDTDKVLEEGCWANVDFSDMPARGVLVEHRRLK